jgi:hypothetical protein
LFQSSSSSSNPSTLTQHAFHEIDGKLVGFNLVLNMTAGISPKEKKNSYCSVVLLPMTRIFLCAFAVGRFGRFRRLRLSPVRLCRTGLLSTSLRC